MEKQSVPHQNTKDIFDRLKAGEPIHLNDLEYPRIQEVVNRTIELSAQLNASINIDQIRERLSEIIGTTIDESTTYLLRSSPILVGSLNWVKMYLLIMPVHFLIWVELL